MSVDNHKKKKKERLELAVVLMGKVKCFAPLLVLQCMCDLAAKFSVPIVIISILVANGRAQLI